MGNSIHVQDAALSRGVLGSIPSAPTRFSFCFNDFKESDTLAAGGSLVLSSADSSKIAMPRPAGWKYRLNHLSQG
jgi:hypothetical protein